MLTFLCVGFILLSVTMFFAFYVTGLAMGVANLGIRTIEKIFKEKF
jgi:hypothetical protein